ncbi:hypothetical protein ACFL2V_16500 [Pseudomonadota bacterium]
MKPSYKIASSVGAAALILAGSAIAADAITPGLGSGTNDPFGDIDGNIFDQWTVTNGDIDADACTNNFTCGSALEDEGFFTRLVTNDSTGEMFFQTIVTEFNANGPIEDLAFSDENFVSGSNNSGILDRQRISQIELVYAQNNTVSGFGRFDNFTEIGTGWASDYLVLNQKIKEELFSTNTIEDFQTDFIFHQKGYSDESNKSVAMKITQYVPIANVAANNTILGWDSQNLVLVDLRGDFAPDVANPGADVELADSGFNGQNQLGGGSLFWNATDRIYGLWIGEDLNDVAGQQFGFVAYDIDPETAGDRIQAFTLADTWDEPGIGAGETPGWSTSLWGTLETTGTISTIFPHPLD